ncbi:MAG: PIG-L deacetylase family protein [Phycisphaeraceae bacterium]
MPNEPLRILVIGAHPDDCDIKCGGVAARYADAGHAVCFLSVTNGDAGHHEVGGIELARRRRAEAEAAGRVIGIDYQVLDFHDAELMPDLHTRKVIIRFIRNFNPDLVLTHRPNDYHPDHRYTSLLVQDASYLITVPNVCTDTPAMKAMPVIAYSEDSFKRPYPFTPDVAVGVDDVMDKKVEMLHQHTSQMYEWLAWLGDRLGEVPADEEGRRAWLRKRFAGDQFFSGRFQRSANRYRDLLVKLYGPDRGNAIQCAEAFELCEYGRQPDEAELRRLFPFFD